MQILFKIWKEGSYFVVKDDSFNLTAKGRTILEAAFNLKNLILSKGKISEIQNRGDVINETLYMTPYLS